MSEVASRSVQSVRVNSVILQLTKTKHVDPVFPDAARRADGQMVVVEVVIGRDGKVQDAKILRSVPDLDRAALDAVRQWEYVPTYFAGEPIPVIAVVTVSFGKK